MMPREILKNKVCSICHEMKPRSDYYLRSKAKGWISAKCKKCQLAYYSNWIKNKPGKHAQYSRAQRVKNPSKFKAKAHKARLRYLYDISVDQFDSMFRGQNGACAICGKQNLNGRRLCIDHDHKTGKVRGLLCSPCNGFLGQIDDDKSAALKAIQYLEKYENSFII